MLIPNKHNGYSRDGRRLYYMDGGSDAPAAEQKASTELPEWAKPYAKDILAKGQALTDVNQNPYQTYGQERIAGFSPMQQQAMQNAQGMTVAPQTGEATAGATMAGMGGLGVAGQANPYGFQSQVGGYMNPYLQMSLAPQLAEANRQYDIGATKQQSAATQAGAFGGSREAIMAAENERNRNTGLNQIIGQGYNQAFGQAQNQYNQNLQNQLAGFGLTNQAAANLGQLGQNQYGQQMGINQLQNQYGGQQQAQMQRGLDTSYQDFLNQQNYPYKQLGFMSDMIRGLPLGQQSTTQMYQAPPTALQTAGSLALTGYGINQLSKADGGSVYGYADGGEIKTYAGDQGSVTSSDNIEAIIGRLNPQQLQVALKNAQARGDKPTIMLIAQQLEKLNLQAAADKSMSQGIAGAMPQEMADGVVSAAGGGILAFNQRGLTPRTDLSEGEGGSEGLTLEDLIQGNKGNPAAADAYNAMLLGQIQKLQKSDIPTYTADDRKRGIRANYEELESLAGPSPYGDIKGQIEKMGTEGQANLQQQKGLAALSAAAGLVQGNNLARGIGNASAGFAQAYAPAIKANQDLKRSMASLNINLADAQRQEKLGNAKGAIAAEDQARRDRADILRATTAKDKAIGDLAASGVRLNTPRKGAGGAGGAGKPNPTIYSIEGILGGLTEEHAGDPAWTPARLKREAVAEFNRQTKQGTAGVEAKQLEAWDKEFATKKNLSPTRFKKMVDEKFGGDEAAAERDFRQRKINNLPTDMYTFSKDRVSGGSGANAAPALPPGFNPVR
jgi:hypothetical protein